MSKAREKSWFLIGCEVRNFHTVRSPLASSSMSQPFSLTLSRKSSRSHRSLEGHVHARDILQGMHKFMIDDHERHWNDL